MDCVICDRPEKEFPMVFRGQRTCSVICGKQDALNQTPVVKPKRRKPAKK